METGRPAKRRPVPAGDQRDG